LERLSTHSKQSGWKKYFSSDAKQNTKMLCRSQQKACEAAQGGKYESHVYQSLRYFIDFAI